MQHPSAGVIHVSAWILLIGPAIVISTKGLPKGRPVWRHGAKQRTAQRNPAENEGKVSFQARCLDCALPLRGKLRST